MVALTIVNFLFSALALLVVLVAAAKCSARVTLLSEEVEMLTGVAHDLFLDLCDLTAQ
eukprot:CAMPEP_0171657004 /NCGR_PEP_ID=MMETSP0990-20121206/41968_1 /TAXON_ID=483369 /ORGANISM="non described non described, Strain CCMP2098" /LENGTH=57 /DNA_ID=CAMNT_0012237685 /DNA_START=17 /DNA_END=188 /DNA_ORIENTATION=+